MSIGYRNQHEKKHRGKLLTSYSTVGELLRIHMRSATSALQVNQLAVYGPPGARTLLSFTGAFVLPRSATSPPHCTMDYTAMAQSRYPHRSC